MLALLPPILLNRVHELDQFDCGVSVLNQWLQKKAIKNQLTGASRCFVLCENQKVIGYYSLSSGAINRQSAPKSMQRNMPESLPIVLIGRLAIDQQYHNKGLGSALLQDAVFRIMNASLTIGVFAILRHALSEPVKRFYLSCGFVESPIEPMTLMMTLETARLILNETTYQEG